MATYSMFLFLYLYLHSYEWLEIFLLVIFLCKCFLPDFATHCILDLNVKYIKVQKAKFTEMSLDSTSSNSCQYIAV